MNRTHRNKRKPSDLFTDKTESFHTITTDEPRFVNLGLSSFTTGILYDWMFAASDGVTRNSFKFIDDAKTAIEEKNNPNNEGRGTVNPEAGSNFIKQQLARFRHMSVFDNKYVEDAFDNPLGGSTKWPTEAIFYGSDDRAIDENCSEDDLEVNNFFYGWRNEGRNGEYKLFDGRSGATKNRLDKWTYKAGNLTYTWADLEITDFNNKHFVGPDLTDSSFESTKYPLVSYEVEEDDEEVETFGTYANIVPQIIEMNNYVNTLRTISVDEWTRKDGARAAFIRDIKTSKFGCFQWTTNVAFFLDLPQKLKDAGLIAGDCDDCVKKIQVNYKLYLYDNKSNRKDGAKRIVKNDTLVALPRTTADGRSYTEKDESGITPLTSSPSVSNAVVAPIQTTYSELEGTFESGTQQLFAIMNEDVEAADQPTIDELEEKDENYLLDKLTGMGVKTGKATVISMQNANPKQWMPDFKKPKNCRGENNEKVTVDVVNVTARLLSRGENVILQKIGGVWVPLSVGENDTLRRVDPASPRWEFMHLMTNSHFFFKGIQDAAPTDDTLITPDQYEQAFYAAYYNDRYKLNSENNFDENKSRYPVTNKAHVENGYFQLTSWDFMGCNIGGTRRKNHSKGYEKLDESGAKQEQPVGKDGDNGNALSNTQALFDVEGTDYGSDDRQFNSYPFFGCVFPEGYAATGEYAELMGDDKDFFLGVKDYNHKGPSSDVPFHYATEKPPFENSNNVRNVIDAPQQELGMFPKGEVGELKHLPADIGTNACPSGLNGRPISNIGMIGEFNTFAEVSETGIQNQITKYFKEPDGEPNRYSWMHKKDTDEGNNYSSQDSAFDLTPVNPLNIQFRPLLAEVYACMEGWNWNGLDKITPNFSYTISNADRGQLALEASNFTFAGLSNYCPPISSHAVVRNKHIIADLEDNLHNLYNIPSNGKIYNHGVPYDIHNNYGLRYKPDLIQATDESLADGDSFPYFWWNDRWQAEGIPDIERSAGGIGIIGAVLTVASLDNITFKTDNRLGLDDFLTGLVGGEWADAWEDGTYSSQNNIGLWARVYQRWPRDLTIYDPRYFVVHHFNPDVSAIDDDIESDWYSAGVIQDEDPSEPYSYPDGSYQVHKLLTSDVRVPTDIGTDSHDGVKVIDPRDIYSDSTGLREKEDWQVTKIRRGKLLPYSYKVMTIRPKVDEDYDGTLKCETINEDEPVNAENLGILIVNGGTGYTDKDTFQVTGSNSGFGSYLKPIVADGTITGFTYTNVGFGYDVSDFAEQGAVFKLTAGVLSPTATLSIVDKEKVSKGTGLEAYVITGRIGLSDLITDYKPKEALAGGPIELSKSKVRGSSRSQTPQLEGSQERALPIKNPSKNGNYDIFFHFHNDISQNRATSSFGSLNIPNQLEQYVTCEVMPTYDSTTAAGVEDEGSTLGAGELDAGLDNLNGILDGGGGWLGDLGVFLDDLGLLP